MKSDFINCKNCTNDCRCKGKDITPICISFKPAKTTNADRLRAMSDEELAEFYCNEVDACPPGSDMKCIDELYAHGEWPYPSDEQCRKCWLDWLRQEADT